jgi:MFS family permease
MDNIKPDNNNEELQVIRNLRKNFVTSTADGVLMNLVAGLVNPFLGVFALRLGASNILLGLITSLPALINTIVFIPGSKLIQKYTRKLPIVLTTGLLARIFYFLFGSLALLNIADESKALIFVILLALMNIPNAITAAAWTEMIGKVFPADRRASLIGLRNMYGGAAAMLATLIAGVILDLILFPINFAVLFYVGFALAMASIVFLSKTIEPEGTIPKERQTFDLRTLFPKTKQGTKFKYFCLSSFFMQFGLFMTAPVGTVYLVNQLKLSNSSLSLLTTAASLTAVIAFPIWGRIAGQRGNRSVLFLSMIGLTIFAFVFTLSPSLIYLVIIHLILGVFNAGWGMTIFTILLNYTNPENKSTGIAFFNSFINFAVFLSPFLGSYLLNILDITYIFLIAGGIRLIGLLLLTIIMNFDLLLGREYIETYHINS